MSAREVLEELDRLVAASDLNYWRVTMALRTRILERRLAA